LFQYRANTHLWAIISIFAALIKKSMNKDSIIGFILIALILVGYSIWMTPSKEEMLEKQRRNDSIRELRVRQQVQLDSLRLIEELRRQNEPVSEQALVVGDSLNENDDMQLRLDRFGAFANASKGEEQLYTVENEVMKLTLTSKGGFVQQVELKDFKTWDQEPLIIFDPATARMDLSFFSRNRLINTADLHFTAYLQGQPLTNNEVNVGASDSLTIVMRAYTNNDQGIVDQSRYIDFVYHIRKDQYMLGFGLNFKGMDQVMATNTNFVNLDWTVDLLQQEKTVDRFNGSTIYFKHLKDDVDYLSETKNDEKTIKTRLKWVSFKQRFFTSSLIAGDFFDNADLKTFDKPNQGNTRYLKSMQASVDLPIVPASDQELTMAFYFGPNSYNDMRPYKLDLERQIPLGWGFFLLAWINIYVVVPVFNFLGSYGWNYGIVILVLTIILKTVLFPIAYKTYLSSAKMRVLKPEIDEISAKFPKQEDAMKKQQAVMALYKRAGVNPMAGCVPMLLQMPILIAMFRFFPSSIELRQQAFLWAEDLSSYDSVLDLPFEIPFYGAHVSLFTLLMTVSTIIYTYQNNQMMGSQSNQLPGMKTMMYLMPIMFLGLFNNYASGLSYYYLLANLITFAQMYIFRLSINENKLRAQIEENKKKPVKKSAFQQRLEEAARKRGMK